MAPSSEVNLNCSCKVRNRFGRHSTTLPVASAADFLYVSASKRASPFITPPVLYSSAALRLRRLFLSDRFLVVTERAGGAAKAE
jgi:hypothetical protein